MKEMADYPFMNSLEGLIKKIGNSKLMKDDIFSYLNNTIDNIQECYKNAEAEIRDIEKIRKCVYRVNISSKDILKENFKSYMWKNSYPMLWLFGKRYSFELTKDTIENDISLNKKFLIFFDFKLNYIKRSKVIMENFYNKIKENNSRKDEICMIKKFTESINILEERLDNIKYKKESLIELEKTFYENVYGNLKI